MQPCPLVSGLSVASFALLWAFEKLLQGPNGHGREMAFGYGHGQGLLTLPQSFPVLKPHPIPPTSHDLAAVAVASISVVFCKLSTEGHNVRQVTTSQVQSWC